MSEWSITIPGRPIPQSRPRVTKTGHVYYTKTCTAYRKTVLAQMLWSKPPQFDEPVCVYVVADGMRSNADGDNLMKLVLDCLVDAEIIPGDSVKHVPAFTFSHWPGEGPALLITVKPF